MWYLGKKVSLTFYDLYILICYLFNKFVKNNHQNTDIACISYKCIYSPIVLKYREEINMVHPASLPSMCSTPLHLLPLCVPALTFGCFLSLQQPPDAGSFLQNLPLPPWQNFPLVLEEILSLPPHFLHMPSKAQQSTLAVTGEITNLFFQWHSQKCTNRS